MIINAVGRGIPEQIEGYGNVRPYRGVFATSASGCRAAAKKKDHFPGKVKVVSSLREAIEKAGLKDGMTVSFHHHLRNGDRTVNLVMDEIAGMGFKDIHLAATGLFACHEPLVKMIEDEIITKISTDTFNPGPVATAIAEGKLRYPAVLMTHGGRPRAVEADELHINIAFIAAPSCDEQGNINGTEGRSACGFLSYAYADAMYADVVVAVTDNLVPYPNCPIEISQDLVDYVVCVDSIGDPGGIVSGSTKITEDPVRLKIASYAAQVADEAGYIRDGMSFQTGASGTSLAVAAMVRQMMKDRNIQGSFGLGGIHAYFVQMLEEGLFRALLDAQCFDLDAVGSAGKNKNHIGISASLYANPHNAGCVAHQIDTVILGATEIDLDFNVNVITGSNGNIIGAAGGHSDVAAGAKLTIIVANLVRKNICVVRDRVTTVTTPGASVDVLVTEYGIAVNPARKDLIDKLKDSDLPIVDMAELKRKGEEIAGPQKKPATGNRIIGVVEFRDGTVIDVVHEMAK